MNPIIINYDKILEDKVKKRPTNEEFKIMFEEYDANGKK